MATPGKFEEGQHPRTDAGKFKAKSGTEAEGGTEALQNSQAPGCVMADVADPDGKGGAYRLLHGHFEDVESSLEYDGEGPNYRRHVMLQEAREAQGALDSITSQLQRGSSTAPELIFAERAGVFNSEKDRMEEAAHVETQRVFRDEFPEVATYDVRESDSEDAPKGKMVVVAARRGDGSDVDEEQMAKIEARTAKSTSMLNPGSPQLWIYGHPTGSDGLTHTFGVGR